MLPTILEQMFPGKEARQNHILESLIRQLKRQLDSFTIPFHWPRNDFILSGSNSNSVISTSESMEEDIRESSKTCQSDPVSSRM